MADPTHQWSVHCPTAKDTQELATAIGTGLTGGTVIALSGALGAGKTTFIQGLGAGLGVVDAHRHILSPTYGLMHLHSGKKWRLVHIDFYRCADEDELEPLGIIECIGDSASVCAIEWADRFPALVGEFCGTRPCTIALEWHDQGGRIVRATGLPLPPTFEAK